jgi:hypothetical protein
MVDHEHCPHYESGEPNGTRIEVCCQCDARRTVTVTPTSTAGHGPYIPPGEATKEVDYGEWA